MYRRSILLHTTKVSAFALLISTVYISRAVYMKLAHFIWTTQKQYEVDHTTMQPPTTCDYMLQHGITYSGYCDNAIVDKLWSVIYKYLKIMHEVCIWAIYTIVRYWQRTVQYKGPFSDNVEGGSFRGGAIKFSTPIGAGGRPNSPPPEGGGRPNSPKTLPPPLHIITERSLI